MATDDIHYLIILAIFLTTTFSGPPDVHAEDKASPTMIQIMIGEMNIANNDDQIKGNHFDVLLLGASAQKSYGGILCNYGLKVGGLFYWQSDIRSYVIYPVMRAVVRRRALWISLSFCLITFLESILIDLNQF